MKRKIFAIALIAVCFAIAAYGTLAYFTYEDTATNVIITGSAAPKILNAIHSLPSVPFKYYHIEDFEEAIKKAASVTPKSGSVVLSPACASFDRFKDYKERGDFFANIVNNL